MGILHSMGRERLCCPCSEAGVVDTSPTKHLHRDAAALLLFLSGWLHFLSGIGWGLGQMLTSWSWAGLEFQLYALIPACSRGCVFIPLTRNRLKMLELVLCLIPVKIKLAEEEGEIVGGGGEQRDPGVLLPWQQRLPGKGAEVVK